MSQRAICYSDTRSRLILVRDGSGVVKVYTQPQFEREVRRPIAAQILDLILQMQGRQAQGARRELGRMMAGETL